MVDIVFVYENYNLILFEIYIKASKVYLQIICSECFLLQLVICVSKYFNMISVRKQYLYIYYVCIVVVMRICNL
jgi:hypothetical protein